MVLAGYRRKGDSLSDRKMTVRHDFCNVRFALYPIGLPIFPSDCLVSFIGQITSPVTYSPGLPK